MIVYTSENLSPFVSPFSGLVEVLNLEFVCGANDDWQGMSGSGFFDYSASSVIQWLCDQEEISKHLK
jgi:hypothetical protein